MSLGGGHPSGAAAAPGVPARTTPLCSRHTPAHRARAWPWSDSPAVFTTLREPDVSFQRHGVELRAPENGKEQIEMVLCPEEVPALLERTVNGT